MAYGGRYHTRRRLGGSYKRGPYIRPGANAALCPWRPPKRPASSITGAPLRLGRRVRPRMAGTRTFTKTQRKKPPGKVTSHGDNQSSSVNTIGKRWLSRFDKLMLRKIVAPQTVSVSATGTATSSQGKQGIYAYQYMSKTHLTGMETAANGGTSTSVPVKFFLKNGKHTMRIRNQANTNCRLSIYDIVTKKNTVGTNYDSPMECWDKGLTDYGVAANGYLTVGQTPYRSPEFNQYFAVNRVTTVSLEPGQQHDHTVYHKYNRVVDSIQFQNQIGTSIAGFTRYTMLVYHGTLGHDAVSTTTVTYMPIALDIAYSYEYTYGWIEKTARAYTLADSNPTTVTDFDFMGESGDQDVNLIQS